MMSTSVSPTDISVGPQVRGHRGKRRRQDSSGITTPTPEPVSRSENVTATTTKEIENEPAAKPAAKKPRKRKTKESSTPTTPGNNTPTDPSSSVAVECVILPPWPEYFQTLFKTHKALNLVYTFCSTRKHLLTTFENLRSAVESHIKRPLLIEDVAAIAALRPEGIRFEYVDEGMLQIDVLGSERDDTFQTGGFRSGKGKGRGRGAAQSFAPDISVGGVTGLDSLDVNYYQHQHQHHQHQQQQQQKQQWGGGGGEEGQQGKQVLFFEFIDEDLKRQVQDKKTGQPTKPTRMLRQEALKMPVFSQKQLTNLIEKRNVKFEKAVNVFLNGCVGKKKEEEEQAHSIDPELMLKSIMVVPQPITPNSTTTTLPGEGGGGGGGGGGSNTLLLPPPPPPVHTIPETIPKERKSIPEIVQELKDSPWYTGQIVPDGHRVFDAQEAVYGDLDFLLSQSLVNALYNSRGITQFYAHQAEAINALVHQRRNVVVSTSTSSGKSLIYQLPVLHALEKDRNTRAMYIFPTKALAQDQKRSLREMMGYMTASSSSSFGNGNGDEYGDGHGNGGGGGISEILVETFDGDTPMSERNTIRDEARIIFTNPDMLHITILPQEERWRGFLKNLRYVVVDELHYYNGLMGSHVAFIMRRLRRICKAVGNNSVRFVSCSATVANPREHFKRIFGIEDVVLVDFDGSPSGRKEFLCWNTPFKDPGDPSSGRGNALFECARLFCQLVLRGVRVIAFCRVREQCEKLVGAVKHELEALGRAEVIPRVMGYRGGYTAQDRRQIEGEMFEGKLMGIVATTALELGVDIGSLDCVLTWGFPYTIANLRQQSGRAGRRNKDSLSILVGDCFATDQHYMQNPDELFTKPNCELQVDLDNMLVREGHIQCAAYEMPIRPEEDSVYFGEDLALLCANRLVRDETGFYHCHDRFRPSPSKFVSIRDTEEEHFAIIDITHGRNVVLEELEASRATFTIYDGAIFLHQGTTYLVRDFDPDKRMARVEKVKVDWTTTQRDYTDVDPVETEAIKRIAGSACRAYYGPIKITQVVFGYFKVDRKNRVLDAIAVDNPPVIRHSKGMWLDIPKSALDILADHRLHIAGAIHAAEHAVMSLMPNFVVSMPGDVRTECKNSLKEFAKRETKRKRPARLTFYDAKGGAGGSGINTKAFEFVDLLLRQALERVGSCACLGGCVECVASELCHEGNEVLCKSGSLVILKSLLGEIINESEVPYGPEEPVPPGLEGRGRGGPLIETVVLADPVLQRRTGGRSGVHSVEDGEIG